MATLYAGGRVFDGEKVLDGQAVLEEGGKVKRIAPLGEFAGFAGEKVDTSGATLIPGIIDCHVHSLSGAEGNPGAVQDRMSHAQLTVRGMEHMRATLEGELGAGAEQAGRSIERALLRAARTGQFGFDDLKATAMAVGRQDHRWKEAFWSWCCCASGQRLQPRAAQYV